MTAMVLVLLFLVSGATHHPVSCLWVVLVPVLLFALVVIRERGSGAQVDGVSFSELHRPSLFQRPPPSLI
jgi:hypothetical protein